MVHYAAWNFILRYEKRHMLVGIALAGYGLLRLSKGDHSFYNYIFLICPFVVVAHWFNYTKKAASIFKALKDKSIIVTFNDSSISFKTDEVFTDYKWSAIKSILRLKKAWLIFFATKNNYNLIPSTKIDGETEAFIVKKAKENNIKIV